MNEEIENLTEHVAEQAGQRCGARLLMTHPGVRPVTALATEVFLGDARRFADGKALASYVGMIPREYSSGEHQRLAGLTKQGNPLLRFLWGEAGAHAARCDPELQRFYRRKLVQKRSGESSRSGSAQARHSPMDHVARSDRLPRVLSSWTEATQCCLCGDA
jgi:transposase